jgi:hypothetical protein
MFHTRSYRELIRPEFQNLVAFNAASTTAFLAAPPQSVGVTATLFPFVPCYHLFRDPLSLAAVLLWSSFAFLLFVPSFGL